MARRRVKERGHSSLIGNVDVRILCERPDNRQATLEWVKVKEGPDGINFCLELDVVEFGRGPGRRLHHDPWQ